LLGKDRISYHESVLKVYQRLKDTGMDTIWAGTKLREWVVILTNGVHSTWGESYVPCALPCRPSNDRLCCQSVFEGPLAASAAF
jgi:hypothetical protein